MKTPLLLFVTGTDTDIGKTYITSGLLRGFNHLGYQTIGLKPIATGYAANTTLPCNDDALQLQAAASVALPYSCVNPFILPDPTSPNIATEIVQKPLHARMLYHRLRVTTQKASDAVVIEGVGGWSVPINENECMADFVRLLAPKIILVVGMKLGCLNHAILTVRSIQQSGLDVIGWIGNCITPSMPYLDMNIKTLNQWLAIPCLGVVPYDQPPEKFIDFSYFKSDD